MGIMILIKPNPREPRKASEVSIKIFLF